MKETYLTTILPQIPRLIGQQDRNPLSPTYGCFDRQFWHYKVTGIPSARYQEAGLTLALLYGIRSKQNPYYHQQKIKSWALASVRYLTKIQSKNGSFNEWYPNEHSFVATAFSLYAATEICLIFPRHSGYFLPSLIRAADWLCRQTELDASNQQAGACVALYNLFLLTKNPKYQQAASDKFAQIAASQTNEGWVVEYGGADIGYSTVMADYLAKYYQKSQDSAVLPVLHKLLDFLNYFIHPDYSWGGEYGSRNTEYVLPHGMEICSSFSPAAQRLSQSLLQHLAKNPLNLDDRYLCNNGYTFLQAYQDYTNQKNDHYKFLSPFAKTFPNSGLFVTANNSYYLVGNVKKGGALKLYDQKSRKLVFEHAGPIGQLADGRIISTQYIDPLTAIRFTKKSISIRGNFKYVKSVESSTIKQLAFHTFQLVAGANPVFAKFAKKFLRKILIVGQRPAPITFELLVELERQKVRLRWKIVLIEKKVAIRKLYTRVKYSLAYIPSSRFFLNEMLGANNHQLSRKSINRLNQEKAGSFQMVFNFPTKTG